MFGQIVRILTFRATLADFERLENRHLAAGLVAAWLVGIGRYWDNPRVGVLQHAGAGSVVYVFLLSALLFVLGLGLRPERWSYRNLLTFVALTSFPGLIYAIPVERFLAPGSARMANLWFLAVVAFWRMALYAVYLKRYAGLKLLPLVVQLLLPVSAIVFALSALNLEHAVFDIMSGVRRETTSADEAYMLVILMTILSVYVAPLLFLLYVVLAVLARRSPVRTDQPTHGGEPWDVS
jgi:hypothetical protein